MVLGRHQKQAHRDGDEGIGIILSKTLTNLYVHIVTVPVVESKLKITLHSVGRNLWNMIVFYGFSLTYSVQSG